MTDNKFAYLDLIFAVLYRDNSYVQQKDRQYGSSWKKRGGVGAFMMLARKWDRLEEMLMRNHNYDLFEGIRSAYVAGIQGQDGTILAEIRDLRRYLALVEAEMVHQGSVTLSGLKEPADISLTEVYNTASLAWGMPRRVAKARLLELLYGEGDGTRTEVFLGGGGGGPEVKISEPAQGHMDLEGGDGGRGATRTPPAETLELSPAADSGPAPSAVAPAPAEGSHGALRAGTTVRRVTDNREGILDGSGTYEIGGDSYGGEWRDGGFFTMQRHEFTVCTTCGGTKEIDQGLGGVGSMQLRVPCPDCAGEPAAPTDHINDRVVPRYEPMAQRQPRNATNAEYEAIRDQTIPTGPAAGKKWAVLYRDHAEEDGRWVMDIHTEEYGQ